MRWTAELRWLFAMVMVMVAPMMVAVVGIGLTAAVSIEASRPPNLPDLLSLLVLAGFVAIVTPGYRFFLTCLISASSWHPMR